MTNSQTYFTALRETICKLPFAEIDRVVDLLAETFDRGRWVYIFGNGGSAALASHFACDLAKGTINGNPKRFRVLALTDNIPLMTAWANDSSYENIFAEQLKNFVRPRDIALAISGSGNSPNVLKALTVARSAGATTVGLTGFRGGKMKSLCDHCVVIPCDNMQIIEDLHVAAAHALFTCLCHRLHDRAAICA